MKLLFQTIWLKKNLIHMWPFLKLISPNQKNQLLPLSSNKFVLTLTYNKCKKHALTFGCKSSLCQVDLVCFTHWEFEWKCYDRWTLDISQFDIRPPNGPSSKCAALLNLFLKQLMMSGVVRQAVLRVHICLTFQI